MPTYQSNLHGITPTHLRGFFDGWPHPPSPQRHLEILRASDHVALALDDGGRVVGFATCITDGLISAYIPLLEVRPEARGGGIGRALINHLLTQIPDVYMIDAVCDDDVVTFYEGLGFTRLNGMAVRRHEALAR